MHVAHDPASEARRHVDETPSGRESTRKTQPVADAAITDVTSARKRFVDFDPAFHLRDALIGDETSNSDGEWLPERARDLRAEKQRRLAVDPRGPERRRSRSRGVA